MDTENLKQNSLSRGWLETKRQHTGFLFWAFEVIASAIVAAITENPWAAPGTMGGIVVAILLYNVLQAPVWQRDEARAMLDSTTFSGGTDALAGLIKDRDFFTLKEAACIKAGSSITHGEVTGPASGYLYDLKKKVLDGEVKASGMPDPLLASTLKLHALNPKLGAYSPLSDRESEALGRAEVSKKELIRIGFIDEGQ